MRQQEKVVCSFVIAVAHLYRLQHTLQIVTPSTHSVRYHNNTSFMNLDTDPTQKILHRYPSDIVNYYKMVYIRTYIVQHYTMLLGKSVRIKRR